MPMTRSRSGLRGVLVAHLPHRTLLVNLPGCLAIALLKAATTFGWFLALHGVHHWLPRCVDHGSLTMTSADPPDRGRLLEFFNFQGGHLPRRTETLSAERMREWAKAGAEAALKQLRAETIAIERTFPELALPQKRRAVTRTLKVARKRGRQMSADARKAVSERMKKYWAERRKAKAKAK